MDPWTRYWQADRPQSCIPANPASQQAIAEHWVRFGRSLAHRARLIDLATGNGAVPAALVEAGVDLIITAVDRADVDPHRFLAQGALLRDVKFIGGVDLADPNGLPGRYDAATSQFGIEYLPPAAGAKALGRLLGPGGRFQLLLHHGDSEVVRPGRRDLEELGRLFEPQGPMDALREFSRGGAGATDLKSASHRYLSQPGLKTHRLSAQVLTAIERIVHAHGTDVPGYAALAADLHDRVAAERTRLEQLVAAALDESSLCAFLGQLRSHHLSVTAREPLHVDAGHHTLALLGWHVAGHRD